MTAKQLIEELQKMPPDAEVWHVWDGVPRTVIEHVWQDEHGEIMTADALERIYSNFPNTDSELFKRGDFQRGIPNVWVTPPI